MNVADPVSLAVALAASVTEMVKTEPLVIEVMGYTFPLRLTLLNVAVEVKYT